MLLTFSWKITVFWDATPSSLAKPHKFQKNLLLPSFGYERPLYQRMMQQVPLKPQYLPTRQNSVTSEKTVIFKFRAVVTTSTVHPSFFFCANYKYLPPGMEE
jgi:hypothetical protein